jgi:transcriptional regulator with XRE-family HTH domain
MKEKNDYIIEVGECIRECRKKSGISQEKLAELIGSNNITIHRIENGMYAVGIDTFFAIADALKVPIEELCPERCVYIKRKNEFSRLEFQFMRLNEENKKVVYETAMTLINMLNVKQRENR